MRNVKYEVGVIKNVKVISIFDTDVLTIAQIQVDVMQVSSKL